MAASSLSSAYSEVAVGFVGRLSINLVAGSILRDRKMRRESLVSFYRL